MVALKNTEEAFIEFYCLNLVSVLRPLDDAVFLCPRAGALIMHLINLQFENIALTGSLANCCVAVSNGYEYMCARREEGGERLRLQFAVIIVSTTFIVWSSGKID